MEILAFPSGQFGNQEFDSEKEVIDFIQRKFNIVEGSGFHLMKKGDVEGRTKQPAWAFFKEFDRAKVRWNFMGIFIIDRNGQVIHRAGSSTSWPQIEGWINDALATSAKL